ncbi:hypothetical protein ACOSQ4_007022 [Xanthoceras sorbifolium]
MSLSDEDSPILQISGDDQSEGIREIHKCLVRKVLSRKKINREAFRGTIEQIWNLVGRVEIEMVGDNMFVFHFASIYNIPLVCMNRRSASMLAGVLGEVIEIPLESKECWGKFLRVKVSIDISKLLKRGIRLWLEEFGLLIVAPMRYECLPDYCFACGLIDHAFRECTDIEAKKEALRSSTSKYGS